MTLGVAIAISPSLAAKAPGGGGYTSPFEAAGFTYVSARDVLTKAWTDTAGATPADGTDEQSIRRLEPSGGSLWGNQQETTANNWRYADENNANAIGGKPAYYCTVDGNGPSMAADVPVYQALPPRILSGKGFDFIAVVKRTANYDNKSLVSLGTNRPAQVRFYTGNVRAYGFLTGYVQAQVGCGVGDHVVHVRFDTSDNKLKIAVDGGTFAEVLQTDEWTPDSGNFSLGQALHSVAEFGIYDGNYADYATLISEFKDEYGIS